MANAQMRKSLRKAILLAGAGLLAGALMVVAYLVASDLSAFQVPDAANPAVSAQRIAERLSAPAHSGVEDDFHGSSGGATGGVIGTSGKALIGGAFKLVTSSGLEFSDQTLRGAPSVIIFGLLDRDGLAPPALNAVKDSLSEIGPAAEKVRIIFVALDGRPDDLSSLRAFASEYPSLAIVATGDDEALLQIAKTFKFYLRKDHQSGGAADVSYAPFLFIMDAEGNYTSHARLPTDAGTLNPLIRAALD